MINKVQFLKKRKAMVDEQIIARELTNQRILEAFLKVPRHEFIPEKYIQQAYEDHPVDIGEGQTISQPYMAALMASCLDIKTPDKILEIGTGSGYQTAILAELAKEVYTIERYASLSKKAKGVLEHLGYKNIRFNINDGSLGWQEFAPYEGIIVTCAAENVPDLLKSQLKETGRMVIPLGGAFSQVLTLIKKNKDRFVKEKICTCVFVPLVRGAV